MKAPDQHNARHVGKVNDAAMLHKPYRRRELADAVRRALYAGPSSRVVG